MLRVDDTGLRRGAGSREAAAAVGPSAQTRVLLGELPELVDHGPVSDACWRTCAAHCGGRFETCVGAPVLNLCRSQADSCDLACQKRCRANGGPLLDITN